MQKPTIFISSSSEGLHKAHELARQLGAFANVTLWSEGAFALGKTVVESLTEMAERSDFAVFLLTGDDAVRSRSSGRLAPRDNLIFELGFLAGRLGMTRTFLVTESSSQFRLPSDLSGIAFLSFQAKSRSDLPRAIAPVARAIQRTIQQLQPRTDRPIEFYSCFVSYSWNDKEFATQLHDDLQAVGVRCWLDGKDLKPGDRIADQVDRAIQVHDKVLLVLSRASLESQWVKHEIRHALRLEQARRKTVLFPISIDDSVFAPSKDGDIEALKQKLIIDFSKWQSRQEYRRAFKRLVQGLAISASAESGGQD